jgi:hypothetical protein
MGLIHGIYKETITRITDNQQNQIVNYPEVSFNCSFDVNLLFI